MKKKLWMTIQYKIHGVKMRTKNVLYHVLTLSIYCFAEIIFTHCNMSGDLIDEVSWFLG